MTEDFSIGDSVLVEDMRIGTVTEVLKDSRGNITEYAIRFEDGTISLFNHDDPNLLIKMPREPRDSDELRQEIYNAIDGIYTYLYMADIEDSFISGGMLACLSRLKELLELTNIELKG